MLEDLRQTIARNRTGESAAMPSVCTAHPDVLAAVLTQAERLDRTILIEATSNQVNQFGGYTGQRPADFVASLQVMAERLRVDPNRLIFGGDHLGTQVWRHLPPAEAMEHARVLVREYTAAGFAKIHLDCAEGCAGDPAQLPDELTSERSADLARVCADEADDLLFVIGTEVPPPGGARHDEEGHIPATDPAAARRTLDMHMAAFGPLADLIGGLVVQPGVEFSPTKVFELPLARDPGLRAALAGYPKVCLEAHSTDYQPAETYPRLADLGFAIQKVGPALTFAYRKALYALDQLRPTRGALEAAMEKIMQADPSHWRNHCHGTTEAQYAARHTGFADRIRYYWATPEAQAAVAALKSDLSETIPEAKLSHVFTLETLHAAEDLAGSQVERLIAAEVEGALNPYYLEQADG